MTKFLLGVLLLPLIATASPVKVSKTMVCDETATVFNALSSSDFKEQPIWVGNAEDSKYTMFVNEKTGSWTLVQFDAKNACILGEGTNSKLILKGPKI